jgi:hypothetical protein
MVNKLKIIGGCMVALVFLVIASSSDAPDKPKPEMTVNEIRQSITRSLCRETVMSGLKVREGATISLSRNHPKQMDDRGVVWSYVDTVRAQNSFGVMLEDLFVCRVSFAFGEGLVTDLKVGHNVVGGE